MTENATAASQMSHFHWSLEEGNVIAFIIHLFKLSHLEFCLKYVQND